jgi:Cft2 family RNA processing exonuclease
MNAAPDIDAVLLSQTDLEHLGALPVLVSSYGLTVIK